jgi:methyltransferase
VTVAPGEPVLGWVVLGALVLWRIVELGIASRNARDLLARGGVLHERDVTGLLVLLHVLTLTGIGVERLLGARIGGLPSIAAAALLLLATAGRLWVLGTLGRRWTIRVITVPGETAVRRGPYRFVRHPNYVVVLAEILAIPALFHAWWTLAIGTIPHAVGLLLRIRCEDAAWRRTVLADADG